MNFETIIMPMAFILLSVVILWFVILSKGFWWLKMLVITLTLFFGYATWNATNTYLGWPTAENLPELYFVHWGVIDEPEKQSLTDEGAIYIWIQDLSEHKQEESQEDKSVFSFSILEYYNSNKINPRVYKIPYTKKKHKEMQKMVKGIKQGKKYLGGKKAKGKLGGEKGSEDGRPGNPQDGDMRANGNGKGGWKYNQSSELEFYELPPPKLPQKF